jgi:outer membrane protein assembly factor BamB
MGQLWSYNAGKPLTTPVYNPGDKDIYVTGATSGSCVMYVINTSGTLIGSFTTSSMQISSPVLDPNSGCICFTVMSRDYMWGFRAGALTVRATDNPNQGLVRPQEPTFDDVITPTQPRVHYMANALSSVPPAKRSRDLAGQSTSSWWFRHAQAGRFVSDMACESGTVYAGDISGNVFAYTNIPGTLSGQQVWTYSAGSGNAFNAKPYVRNGTVYIESLQGNAFAVNSGGVVWSTSSTGTSNQCTPAVDSDGTAYIVGTDGNSSGYFIAIKSDGTQAWSKTVAGGFAPEIMVSPAIAGPYVCIPATVSGTYGLYPVVMSTGVVEASAGFTAVTSSIHSRAFLMSGAIYFGCDDGYLYVISNFPDPAPLPSGMRRTFQFSDFDLNMASSKRLVITGYR